MKPGALREVALYFLRLGFTAFGGPAAHIAMMEDDVVRRLRWMSRDEFLDLIGATNLIPGPNSTEMAIHVGYLRAGWPGLIAAGVCFIVPAASITLGLAWAYHRYGTFPLAKDVLYGIKPVIIAVVGQALWGLARSAVKSRFLAALAVAAVGATFFGVNELLVLLGAGILAVIVTKDRAGISGVGLLSAEPFSLMALFLFFLKVGSVLYGSGYVLLAFLRTTLVDRWGWLTQAQLLDAVAAGQMTPGPVFTTATFVGYLVGGLPGAAAATIGIFLPSFVFVALSGPLIPKLRRSPAARAFLDGVNVASLALMVVVTLALARSAVVDGATAFLAAAAAYLLIARRVNSAWLVMSGGALGFVLPKLLSLR